MGEEQSRPSPEFEPHHAHREDQAPEPAAAGQLKTLRPEPRRVQGSPALHVVQGGLGKQKSILQSPGGTPFPTSRSIPPVQFSPKNSQKCDVYSFFDIFLPSFNILTYRNKSILFYHPVA
jgi:hypothetical protein